MQYSLSTVILPEYGMEETAELLRRTGFDGAEWRVRRVVLLGAFLADTGCQHLDWPLAKPGRSHVHDRIDRNELPVRHETRRSGRPYTLVLTKTSALFEQERRLRDIDLVDLRWLETILLRPPER